MKKQMEKHIVLLSIMMAIVIIISVIFIMKWPVIFQRGNPIPYLISIVQLNDNKTYMLVEDNPMVFITKRDNYEELLAYIEESNEVAYDEQMGSGYIFRSDEKVITITSEIYWRNYYVWTMSIK
ncbi:MAG: hypothetical protein K0S47_166 [Herbinix sp.]|jgi:hypothetical protein|nr:hypothetical protein [Herbinix sp.]